MVTILGGTELMSTREPSEFRLEFHTDDPAMRELADSYWASSRGPDGRIRFTHRVVEDLAPRFGLRPTAHAVTGPATAAAWAFYGRCIRCGREMQFPHRTAFQQDYLSCGGGLPCKTCREELRRIDEEKQRDAASARRLAIQRTYRDEPAEINVSAMTLRDAVYSLAVLLASPVGDSQRIGEADGFRVRLSPHRDYDEEILHYLFRRRIIGIDPESDASAFQFDERGNPHQYFPLRVGWLLRDLQPARFAERLKALTQQQNYPPSWNAELESLSPEVAEFECLDFLLMARQFNGLQFQRSDDWSALIKDALEAYSVSELQPMILLALKEVYQSKVTAGMSAKAQGVAISTSFCGLLDRAMTGKTKIEPASRSQRCPRSAISLALYEILLKSGDKGFTGLPRMLRLPEIDLASPLIQSHKATTLNDVIIRQAIELSKRESVDSSSGFVRHVAAPTRSPLLVYLAGLSAADRAQVAAVMLIGRGDEVAEDFARVVGKWTLPLEWGQVEYLAGKRGLWKFLEAGLRELGATSGGILNANLRRH